MKIPISFARGDGIGPEIMQATLQILKAVKAPLEYREVEIGEKVYLRGAPYGIEPKSWDVIKQTRAFLKAPITTPQGGGYKSLNVTVRTTLGLYANVRPCISYFPFVHTLHPEMDVVIVRENEEDLYAGIEYQQTPNVACSIKLISKMGSEKIIRYAFEYAKAHGRKKVSCFVKDNIMKLSDGLFHATFKEIASEYPDILSESYIVDIGAARLADTPEIFDVVVMPNLYGDILSDVAAQIAGSVGIAASANIGERGAMFEAIHGSAPKRAGQNVANPSGLLLAAVQMLSYLKFPDLASLIHNSWLTTIENGIHTYDIYKEGISKKKVGTQEFAAALIENLGKTPSTLHPATYAAVTQSAPAQKIEKKPARALVGMDAFIYHEGSFEALQKALSHIVVGPLRLKLIANRGVRLWPDGHKETSCIEQWRARFLTEGSRPVVLADLIKVMEAFDRLQLDLIKTEHLYTLDGIQAFS
jgi:isocitrate dehydrogenase